jgi:hypothetical protein
MTTKRDPRPRNFLCNKCGSRKKESGGASLVLCTQHYPHHYHHHHHHHRHRTHRRLSSFAKLSFPPLPYPTLPSQGRLPLRDTNCSVAPEHGLEVRPRWKNTDLLSFTFFPGFLFFSFFSFFLPWKNTDLLFITEAPFPFPFPSPFPYPIGGSECVGGG